MQLDALHVAIHVLFERDREHTMQETEDMQHVDTRGTMGFFDVVASTSRSQAATMVLEEGRTTGGAENRHLKSDQWLYVVEGSGTAVIGGQEIRLTPGSLLLIEAGETHEIRNSGLGPLRTVNVYAPPAY